MAQGQQRVILFGTGIGGKHGYKHLKKRYAVVGFCDNDTQKQGQKFMGLPIHAPAELEKLDYDRIVICSMYQDEIQDQLNLQLNIPFEKIDILDPDIRNYGAGNPIGCLLAALALLTGIGYGIYRLIAWLRG
jgi:FlaA1/EpsC-like NDP-sugar epimerase